MDFLKPVANFIEKYVMEIAVVSLLILYIVQLIQVRRLKELLSKQ